MSEFFAILISTVLVNNVIVGQVIGTDPALAFSRKLDVAIGMTVTMIILLPLVTTGTYLIDVYLLIPFDLQIMRLLIFVIIILILTLCLKLWGHYINVRLADRINIFLPLAGINTAVLGTVLLNQQSSNGIFKSFAFGIGTGLGFGLILLMLTAICTRLEVADVPGPFRGIPITLITLGLISIGFLGFAGLIRI